MHVLEKVFDALTGSNTVAHTKTRLLQQDERQCLELSGTPRALSVEHVLPSPQNMWTHMSVLPKSLNVVQSGIIFLKSG
jgi:hypothetical protein